MELWFTCYDSTHQVTTYSGRLKKTGCLKSGQENNPDAVAAAKTKFQEKFGVPVEQSGNETMIKFTRIQMRKYCLEVQIVNSYLLTSNHIFKKCVKSNILDTTIRWIVKQLTILRYILLNRWICMVMIDKCSWPSLPARQNWKLVFDRRRHGNCWNMQRANLKG